MAGETANQEYIYRGDRHTSENLKGKACNAVRRPDGKCIRGRNGAMLVSFEGKSMVVIGRLLRKINREGDGSQSREFMTGKSARGQNR